MLSHPTNKLFIPLQTNRYPPVQAFGFPSPHPIKHHLHATLNVRPCLLHTHLLGRQDYIYKRAQARAGAFCFSRCLRPALPFYTLTCSEVHVSPSPPPPPNIRRRAGAANLRTTSTSTSTSTSSIDGIPLSPIPHGRGRPRSRGTVKPSSPCL